MKSFSIKALALAFVVVTGSAQGMFTDADAKAFTDAGNVLPEISTTCNMFTAEEAAAAQDQTHAYWGEATLTNVCDNLDNIFAKVTDPYCNISLDLTSRIHDAGFEKTGNGLQKMLTVPYTYYRISRTVFALGVAAAAYKTYKHFTKPAADATEEGENVEANETTVEVA